MTTRRLIDRTFFCLVTLGVLAAGAIALSQGRPPRQHTATAARPLRLVPANQPPPAENRVTLEAQHGHRHVESNAVPQHPVGRFPNWGNPHAIAEQRHRFNLPLEPQPADKVTPLHLASRRGPPNLPFGVAVNGVMFDPGTAEFWRGDRTLGWNYEALGGAAPLGVDENFAHVQPGGQYHYHGLPTGLLKRLGQSPQKHSPLVGWAADGFPIYAQYGYGDPEDPDSTIIELRSSYRLKPGVRPGGDDAPDGAYDGAFVQDYEYVAGRGDLDECNGRHAVTPEFPQGTYAYFLTSEWPVIPRAFRGAPVRLR
ncbi:hypothetical protein Pla108_39450 [Botrimarina colliarenosi]|uniref:YHYH domain-containing protein n=1 Tax=Botrimarina colliarenosi TaxID=2528001 RepID=A0A5C6A2N2_9BACT|nr:YHYH protein [Botrimarina colliarenosi]TWT93451.1 hypothetical protein Pla108_39450 [Botrimarina colliarenosi]